MGLTKLVLRSNIKNRFLFLLQNCFFYPNYYLDIINTTVTSFIKAHNALYKGTHVGHIFEI